MEIQLGCYKSHFSKGFLILTFEDGKQGVYDFRPDSLRPIFQKQQNIDFFMQAKVLYGTVVWPDDSDIAPEHLYDKLIPITV